MSHERADGCPEMRLAEWHDAVQALGLDRQDKPLGKRVQIRTPRGQQEWLHTAVPQQAPKCRGVERIPVQNEILHAAEEAVAGVEQVPCELRRPHFVRVTGDSGDLHGARLELMTKKTLYRTRPPKVSTSTVNESAAARPSK